MRLLIQNPEDNAITLFRRAGYTFQREEHGEISFVRTLARGDYPRFHVYVKLVKGGFECNIHLDQKRETYGKTTRHHGEYEDEGALAEEVRRLELPLGKFTKTE